MNNIYDDFRAREFFNPSIGEIELAMRFLANSIETRADSKRPDIIIGMQRGGLIPAVYLSHALKLPLVVADIAGVGGEGDNIDSHTDTINDAIMQSNPPKHILIAEDIVDSGISLIRCIDLLRDLGYDAEISIAALYVKEKHALITGLIPHTMFYWRDLAKDSAFVNFPWEV